MTLTPRPTSDIEWATGPAEYPTVDPGGAKKVVGWDGSEIPLAEHHNWLMREICLWAKYGGVHSLGAYEEAYEAIDAGFEYPETFRVLGGLNVSDLELRGRGEQAGIINASDTINVIATDGRYVYLVRDGDTLAYPTGPGALKAW